MARSSMNLQDGFLNEVRKDGSAISVILLDGSVLVGTVSGFDSFTVVLSAEDEQHLVYKHAIARISIPRSVGRAASRIPNNGRSVGNGAAGHEEPSAENGRNGRHAAGTNGKSESGTAANGSGAPVGKTSEQNGSSGRRNGSANGDRPAAAHPAPDRFNAIDLTAVTLAPADEKEAVH